jgi:hypothetical protein
METDFNELLARTGYSAGAEMQSESRSRCSGEQCQSEKTQWTQLEAYSAELTQGQQELSLGRHQAGLPWKWRSRTR